MMPRSCSRHFLLPALLLCATASAQVMPQPDWSTYWGGGGTATVDQPWPQAIAVLPGGHVVVGGFTTSSTFPTRNPIQATFGGGPRDGFIACFDPRAFGGAQVIWSTYLGGSGAEEVRGVAVAANGDIVVCGPTSSSSFLGTPGCHQPNNAGGADMFVARLCWNGNALTLNAFTFLGTAGTEAAESVAVLPGGHIVVAGETDSGAFPIVGTPWQPTQGGGVDGVIGVLDPTLCNLVASTYQGGTGNDYLTSVVVDVNGRLAFAGRTNSPGLWTSPCAFQAQLVGTQDDVYVCCGDLALTQRSYATYLGGTGGDGSLSLALTNSGRIVVGGYSGSPAGQFPTTNGTVFLGGQWDGFVSIFDTSQCGPAQLVWSTLFGTSGDDVLYDLAVGPSGLVTAVGMTNSPSLPVTAGAFQPRFGGGNRDALVVQLDPWSRTGLERLYVSYYGGDGPDDAFAVALDGQGDPVFAGLTGSTNLPVTSGACQPGLAGGWWDMFVADLPPLPAGITRVVGGPGCPESVIAGVNSQPVAGNGQFAFYASGLPAGAPVLLVLGWQAPRPIPNPIPGANICLLVQPVLTTVFPLPDPTGFAMHGVPLPTSLTPPYRIAAQWGFFDPATGLYAASPALRL